MRFRLTRKGSESKRKDGLEIFVCRVRMVFSMVARQIFYTGRVQGVGFRYATKRLAMEFDVVGWVRNLPDGRVELQVAAREAAEVTAFLEELEVNSSLAHHIKEIERHPLESLAGVKGFSIIA